MNLIDEEHAWYDLSTTFLSPFSDFLVNLFSYFGLNFTNVSCEESSESLSSRVDDINLVQSHSVDNFLSLLEFSFWALYKSRLRPHIVIVTASGK